MTSARAFAQVDVFGRRPFSGNPVAVVLDGDGLSAPQMQRIAQWTNLSETTFVQTATVPGADYRLRIFTPWRELPFAGHPTLGSAHAWLEAGGQPAERDRIVQECGAGLVGVRVDDRGVAFDAPPTVRTGPLADELRDRIARALGIEAGDIVDHRWVDNGPGWMAVLLGSAQQVLDLEPDFTVFPEAMLGVAGAYPPGAEQQLEVRAFAPGVGVPEDPVCGSLNASLAQWLTSAGIMPPSYVATQGRPLGRDGRVTIDVGPDGRIAVGGATTTGVRGSLLA